MYLIYVKQSHPLFLIFHSNNLLFLGYQARLNDLTELNYKQCAVVGRLDESSRLKPKTFRRKPAPVLG